MCYWSSVPTFVNSSDLPSRVLHGSDQVERHDGFSLNRERHADTVPPNVLKFLGQKFRHWSILPNL